MEEVRHEEPVRLLLRRGHKITKSKERNNP
jgi:hypothetical protein